MEVPLDPDRELRDDGELIVIQRRLYVEYVLPRHNALVMSVVNLAHGQVDG
jgi:hypothetical protein